MRKAGAQQLQAELLTDEDLEQFLERPGLSVIDIYSEWCGPSLGIVGALRKIKLDVAGDNLHLAIARADTISSFQRFCKKSEPTLLFVTNRKAVNIFFGTDAPLIVSLVLKELEMVKKPISQRTYYALNELQPAEHERLDVKLAEAAAAELKERTENEKKRLETLTEATNVIMENLPDAGVTIFGPHISRDMFKKLNEPAEILKLQCKDRRMQVISKEDFENINYACKNPLDPEVIEQLSDKEVLTCFWKSSNVSDKAIPELLNIYAHELTKTNMTHDDEVIPPIIAPLKLKVHYEVADDEECIVEPDDDWPRTSTQHEKRPAQRLTSGPEEDNNDEALSEEGEEEDIGEGKSNVNDFGVTNNDAIPLDIDIDLDLSSAKSSEEGEEEATFEELTFRKMCTKTVVIPPIWVAANRRSQAALIYVLYRNQTTGFLPPDPVPEPPHIVMAFDTYKKRDLLDLADRHPDEIPLYGFFTSDDADDAQHISSSGYVYSHKPQASSDKLVFKVNKRTSHTMLSLATYGPTYVSPNLTIGETDVAKFFPEGYVNPAVEKSEFEAREVAKPKEREKKKSHSARKSAFSTQTPESTSASKLSLAKDGEKSLQEMGAEQPAQPPMGEEVTPSTASPEHEAEAQAKTDALVPTENQPEQHKPLETAATEDLQEGPPAEVDAAAEKPAEESLVEAPIEAPAELEAQSHPETTTEPAITAEASPAETPADKIEELTAVEAPAEAPTVEEAPPMEGSPAEPVPEISS